MHAELLFYLAWSICNLVNSSPIDELCIGQWGGCLAGLDCSNHGNPVITH